MGFGARVGAVGAWVGGVARAADCGRVRRGVRVRRGRRDLCVGARFGRVVAFDVGGGGSWPDCQRRRISSRRANRRFRLAKIIAITESYSQPSARPPEGVGERIAASRALGVGEVVMGCILTNGFRRSKGKFLGREIFLMRVGRAGRAPLRLPPPKREGREDSFG